MSQPGGIAFDLGSPRTVQGYWWMGGIDVPVRLVRTVLTDRASGQLWELEYNSTAGLVGINQPAPSPLGPGADRNVQVSPALDEPEVASGPTYSLQMFVRNGVPGFDLSPRSPQWGSVSNPPYWLRTGLPATGIQGTPSIQLARMTQASTFNPLNPAPQVAVSFQSPIVVP